MSETSIRARKINKILGSYFPNAGPELNFNSPYELLVAVVLSAQCTDKRVNLVTPDLFISCPGPKELACISRGELEKLIKSTGFYRNKATSLMSIGNDLVNKFNSKVPKTLDELITLKGVGRKTANVVLGEAFGIPGITVDTHVGRLSRRLGFSKFNDPEKVEQDLMQIFEQKEWINISRRLIFLGRRICKSQNPNCSKCPVLKFCPTGVK